MVTNKETNPKQEQKDADSLKKRLQSSNQYNQVNIVNSLFLYTFLSLQGGLVTGTGKCLNQWSKKLHIQNVGQEKN